jgi:hypothetical protein
MLMVAFTSDERYSRWRLIHIRARVLFSPALLWVDAGILALSTTTDPFHIALRRHLAPVGFSIISRSHLHNFSNSRYRRKRNPMKGDRRSHPRLWAENENGLLLVHLTARDSDHLTHLQDHFSQYARATASNPHARCPCPNVLFAPFVSLRRPPTIRRSWLSPWRSRLPSYWSA